MAKGTIAEPDYVAKLIAAIRSQLRGAEVTHEQVRGERYRFSVVWPRFDSMGHPERQRKVWDIAQRVLKNGDLRNVTMILTLGKDDLPKD